VSILGLRVFALRFASDGITHGKLKTEIHRQGTVCRDFEFIIIEPYYVDALAAVYWAGARRTDSMRSTSRRRSSERRVETRRWTQRIGSDCGLLHAFKVIQGHGRNGDALLCVEDEIGLLQDQLHVRLFKVIQMILCLIDGRIALLHSCLQGHVFAITQGHRRNDVRFEVT